MSEKNIQTLIELSRKLGKSICEEGTFEEQKTKKHIMKWKYKRNTFTHKFPGSIKGSPVNYQYYQMRKNLRAAGLPPPREFTPQFTGTVEQREVLEALWSHLGTDDEGGTPYGGDVE
ncbi:MAG: hypothetical protein H8E32_01530 [Nitrospinae bacterium]|nr:hypothetical protein [Nitrospinota bacterium]